MISVLVWHRGACGAPELTTDGAMQDAVLNRATGGSFLPRGETNSDMLRNVGATGIPSNPQSEPARGVQFIAQKDGDTIPEGYKYAVDDHTEQDPSGRTYPRPEREDVDLSTPPKSTEAGVRGGLDMAKNRLNTRRNLTRNSN